MFRHNRLIKELHLELSTNCNLLCPQCPRTLGDGADPELSIDNMSLERIERLLSPSDVASLNHIYACGNYGDPLMCGGLLEILSYFRKHNPNLLLSIHTNGSLRNQSYFEQLAKILDGPHRVVFAIDGLVDTNHVYRRGANWDKLIKNITSFIAAGGKAHCDYLVFEHNEHQIEQAKEFFTSLGIATINFKNTRRRITAGQEWLKPVRIDRGIRTSEIRCTALVNRSLYIDAKGREFPCCYIGETSSRSTAISGINNLDPKQANAVVFNPTQPACSKHCSVRKRG